MTIRQVQNLLDYLGYSPGDIDGVDGPKTKAALTTFSKAYGIDSQSADIIKKSLIAAVAGTLQPIDHSAPVADTTATGASQYLQSDGFYHIPRGVNVRLSKNLWSNEIHCQGSGCCTESKISKRIVDLFQEIRDDMGVPLSIGTVGGSGYRCPAHNSEVGGATGSLHLLSEAVDIHYAIPSALKSVVLRHLKDGEVGLYSWGCHVGIWDRGYISEFNG